MQRAVTKSNSKLVNVWVPKSILPAINQAAVKGDTDRSKYIRQAIREKLDREGIVIPPAE